MIIEMKEDIASIKSILSTMANTNAIAVEAAQSTRSAHHRIAEINDQIKEMRNAQRWLIGTTISVAGLFIAAVGFLWKAVGG
ncbi:hypothetical protein [Paenibacillus senegalensis]|uniref:hypothetical protein n=1 Tax=Paenibacillus senegalensis TaxID=1465766 RepID=UPI0011DE258D|nr:hypothetical protein [Paenibacillus senegalensis]